MDTAKKSITTLKNKPTFFSEWAGKKGHLLAYCGYMKIGIDARMLGPKQGGLGRYIEQLIKHLEPLLGTDQLVVFLRQDNWDIFSPTNPTTKKVLADIPWYGWREQTQFKKIIKAEQVDLMHFPHWNVPLNYNDPFVVTIHDLLLMHFPTRRASTLGPLLYWIKNQAYRLVLRHASKQARAIIATCAFTKNDIIETLHVPAEKISITYQAATKLPANNENPDTILKKYGITKPFVLYVGVSYPHKNLDQLVKSWQLFETTYGTDYQLVLAGKRNYFYDRLLATKTWQTCREVVYTDFVPDNELPALYQKASLYVMPSLYEGYALPSLEALSYGLPVVSSTATCLPEILGEAALYCDPRDTRAIATAIHTGLTDLSFRQKSAHESAKRVALYSPKVLAEQTLQLYRKTVDNIASN